MTLSLEPLGHVHETRFLTAVRRSVDLHIPWVAPPSTVEAFNRLVDKYDGERNISYVAVSGEEDFIGCINLTEIIRGVFQSAFLGFYAFMPFAGIGLMKQAMQLVLAQAFSAHGLHRLEANIQPANERSKRFVRSLGFRHEGHSPRYLCIGGRWCDHDRYAITVEEWVEGNSSALEH